MIETEWLGCTDPMAMLEFLRGKASDRKLRLFACGCVRRYWHALKDARSRHAIEISELYADGLESEDARFDAWEEANLPSDPPSLENAAVYAIESDDEYIDIIRDAVNEVANWTDRQGGRLDTAERVSQCQLLRCIFGNPFRLFTANSTWLTWNGGTVVKLAHAIYDDRAFDRLPILADALEEAGCQDAGILGHCRQQGAVHVRGCWVVDVLTGRS